MVKEDFFAALAEYKDLENLRQKKEAKAKEVRGLGKEKSTLSGEINELERRKATLMGEIDSDITSTCKKIAALTQATSASLSEQVDNIRSVFEQVMVDAVNTGISIGEMRQMVNKGEDAEKSLAAFIVETRQRLGAE